MAQKIPRRVIADVVAARLIGAHADDLATTQTDDSAAARSSHADNHTDNHVKSHANNHTDSHANSRTNSHAKNAALMKELAVVLIDNNMADAADMIMNDIAEVLFARTGRLTVEVTSARELTDEAREHLTRYLREQTGATSVELYESVSPDLVGGLIARTATAELDASIRMRLRQLTALT